MWSGLEAMAHLLSIHKPNKRRRVDEPDVDQSRACASYPAMETTKHSEFPKSEPPMDTTGHPTAHEVVEAVAQPVFQSQPKVTLGVVAMEKKVGHNI